MSGRIVNQLFANLWVYPMAIDVIVVSACSELCGPHMICWIIVGILFGTTAGVYVLLEFGF